MGGLTLAKRSLRKIMENKGKKSIEDILEVHFLKLKRKCLLKESKNSGMKE